MTEEAFKLLQAVLDENEIATEYFDNMVCNADKYRWHDLRKNPEDLPDDERKVYLAVDMKTYITYIIGEYSLSPVKDDSVRDWFSSDGFYLKAVIAWREIEPFEGIK